MVEIPASEPLTRAETRLERHAHTLWIEHQSGGSGRVRGASRTFCALPVSLADKADAGHAVTTPGELLAAAHSASFAVTLADILGRRGTPVRELVVDATCEIGDDGSGGRQITMLQLHVLGSGTGVDAATFSGAADAALACCPISHALSSTVPISIDAQLTKAIE